MKNLGSIAEHFMKNWTESVAFRRLACARCGAEFGCDPAGPCWCKDEAVQLPLPVAGEDCLCPQCVRKAAAAAPGA